jgi:hypothetical protein
VRKLVLERNTLRRELEEARALTDTKTNEAFGFLQRALEAEEKLAAAEKGQTYWRDRAGPAEYNLAVVTLENARLHGGTFFLDRVEDEGGVSGTGRVAQGFVFSDGTVVLRWLTTHKSTAIYESIEELEAIHGHGGKTKITNPSSTPDALVQEVRDVLTRLREMISVTSDERMKSHLDALLEKLGGKP